MKESHGFSRVLNPNIQLKNYFKCNKSRFNLNFFRGFSHLNLQKVDNSFISIFCVRKAMGISSLSDVSSNSGLLVTVIIMAGVSMASMKRMFDSLLQIVCINSSKPEAMETSLVLGSHLARLILIAELDSKTSRSPGTIGNVTECPVCLCGIDGEVDQIRKLRCSHIFHKCCIDRWMDYGQQFACPLCRLSISSDERAMKMEQQLTEELLLWFR